MWSLCGGMPQKCIKIEKNEEGFWEYTVNKEQCINCGLCKKNCGQVHNNAIKIERQKYLVHTLNQMKF